MWNAGPSNHVPQNGGSDDSDDDYEIATVAVVLWYYYTYMERPLPQPRHTSALTGIMRVQYLLDGHEDVIRSKIRMGSDCFKRLSTLLELKGLLRPTRNMNVHEQLFIFLYIVCQSSNNRESQDQWQHSGATISKYFHAVLKALYELRFDFLTPPNFNIVDPVVAARGNKYLPWFQNCIGALDGTHVPVVPPAANAEAWRNRKGFLSQNVLGVCSFDMRFTYMLAGWEGSAHDARVLTSAIETREKNFPTPPERKYYLVDSGYANTNYFLTPYRESTYHLQEYRARRGRPQTPRELFNYTHSSLRNCIERTFGIWKARFRILKCINNYPIQTRIDIPLVCAILHNFIHMYNHKDDLLTQYMRDAVPVAEIDPLNTEQDVNQNHNPDRGTRQQQNRSNRRQMHVLRDEIADSMWAAYENNRR
ncbi:protein ANTAGONIST OF LIKE HETEROCHROMATIN PROTEIN 1-like [Morus notabilis]|uniref:protein ANTAGONIST OF LIKE HETEROCHROMATIN PROTEIN 1-like n=1 Tax=Morus notabilis TaxID=981085 RepID=UPI000CECFE9B|nr:protein ANTAGONIST OF LIKE HETEROCHROMATIN PROTEIN 1-like [Morus notabilis]